MQPAAIGAGGQDHAFAHAEAHLARREIGDEHHVATDQRRRVAIGRADAGEDLALAEFARVEFEAQQLVGAFDELAGEHLRHAQVELREIVDADVRGRRSASGFGLRGFAAATGCAATGAMVSLLASVIWSICFGSMRVNNGT